MVESQCSTLPFFGIIRVSGDDRAAFLHNQLSNDVNHLPIGSACLATYNSPKGRVLANVLVMNRGHDILLVTAADLCDALLKRLRLFVLRSQVVLEKMPDWAVAGCCSVDETDPQIPGQTQHVLATEQQQDVWCITLPNGDIMMLGNTASLPAYTEKNALMWYCHQIQNGQPWINAASSETCVAQMLNQHLLGAIHFKKGCYPGQEIIARAQYRGQVKRGLVLVDAAGILQEGEAIFNDQQEEVGIIINQAPQANGSLGLAVMKYGAIGLPLHTASHVLLSCKFFFFNQPEGAA